MIRKVLPIKYFLKYFDCHYYWPRDESWKFIWGSWGWSMIRYFYNFWSKNTPSLFMKAIPLRTRMLLEEEDIFSSWDSPCPLGLCTWQPFCFDAALFCPIPFCLPNIYWSLRSQILCNISRNIALIGQGCLLISWTNPHQCFSQMISISLLLIFWLLFYSILCLIILIKLLKHEKHSY